MTSEGARDPVGKAVRLLTWLAEKGEGPWGVRQMAAELGTSASTVHRTLATLELHGLIEGVDGQYDIGLELVRLSRQLVARASVLTLAQPFLDELVADCNETAHLGMYDPARAQMVFTLAVESSHPLRYVVEQNRWQPVHAGASGLAILAFLPPEEQAKILSSKKLEALTSETITDVDALRARLQQIVEAGYACSQGQRIPGAVGIAAPIFNHRNQVVGDVCVSLPEYRFEEASEQVLAERVMSCAARISHELGAA